MRSEDVRVLIITNAYPDSSRNYFASQFVSDQVEFLAKFVKEVIVVCPVPLLPIKPFRRSIVQGNIRLIFKYYYPAYSKHVRIGDWLEHISSKYARIISKMVKNDKIEFDVIHAHFSVPCGRAAAILKEELHKPTVLTIHENHEWFLDLIKDGDPSYVKAWKSADLLLRVNMIDIDNLKRYNQNAEYMPNGFNSHQYYLDESIVREKNMVFAMGVFTERKGYQDLVKSISELRKLMPDIKCYIAGQDGGYGEELKNLISSLNLEGTVVLMGPISSVTARKMMNRCTVFCHPSYSESFGVVQIEAMACGAPVVATYNGASERIIEDGCGKVVERSELENGLRMALTEIKWDHRNIQKMVRKYDMEIIAQRLVEKYCHLIK